MTRDFASPGQGHLSSSVIRKVCALSALLAIAFLPSAAEEAIKPEAEGALEVSLVTILPGTSLYSSFGHSAIRMNDRRTGQDRLYNYGVSMRGFDLIFLGKMLIGRMDFMVAEFDTAVVLRYYSEVEDRTIIEQKLELRPDESDYLRSRLLRDLAPERRNYEYRFFTDNCATKVWDLIAPFTIQQKGTPVPSTSSTRRATLVNAVSTRPWLQAFISFALGPAGEEPDRGATKPYLPMQLMSKVGASTGHLGPAHPLVLSTRRVYESRQEASAGLDPKLFSGLILAFALLAALLHRSKISRAFDLALSSVAAALSIPMLSFWLIAGYPEIAWNLNLFWANPLALVALGGKRSGKWLRLRALTLATVAVASAIVGIGGGLGIQVVPPEGRLLSLALAIVAGRHGIAMWKVLQTTAFPGRAATLAENP